MTFKKDDESKPRYDLIPPHAELELAHVLTMGAEKYGPNNWHQGGPESKPRYIAAAQRHISAYRRGETHDPESGRHHLAHAVASLMFVVEFEAVDAGWIGDAVEGDRPVPLTLWTHQKDGFRLELRDYGTNWSGQLLTNDQLVEDSQLEGPHSGPWRPINIVFMDSARKCMEAILDSLVGGFPVQHFMKDAIAAYERESGEVETPSKVWSYADGALYVTVWNDDQRLFANLTHGNRQVKYADGFEDVLDGLGRIQGKCESGEYYQFMNQAIAAFRRSYGLL